jgi:hypothetical protein
MQSRQMISLPSTTGVFSMNNHGVNVAENDFASHIQFTTKFLR